MIDEPPDPNISTFRPLDQQVGHLQVHCTGALYRCTGVLQVLQSRMYNSDGYIPCNGHVPCQIWHLAPELNQERIEGAMPCHNYQGGWRQGYCVTITVTNQATETLPRAAGDISTSSRSKLHHHHKVYRYLLDTISVSR